MEKYIPSHGVNRVSLRNSSGACYTSGNRATGCTMKKSTIIGSNKETLRIFEEAIRFDDSLVVEATGLTKLSQKRLTSMAFSFEHLFENLAESLPCLYFDYGPGITKSELLPILRETLDTFRYKISRELGKEPVELTIGELMREWDKDEQLLRITNLHLRTIDLVDSAKLDLICPFNLLTHGNRDLKKLEMMTLMVSTTGGITESHSDDTDVNNHCIAGRKLWLCWDTSEGMKAGLEDCEKVDVYGKPKFDMETFLTLESSTWALVSEGETLFLPGKYTHKVFTLEKYIGIGGFFVSFPTMLHTFERWLSRKNEFHYQEPLYRRIHGDLVAESIEASLLDASKKIYGQLLLEGKGAQRMWGTQHAGRSIEEWAFVSSDIERGDLEQNHRFRECLAFTQELKKSEAQKPILTTETEMAAGKYSDSLD